MKFKAVPRMLLDKVWNTFTVQILSWTSYFSNVISAEMSYVWNMKFKIYHVFKRYNVEYNENVFLTEIL